MKIKLVGTGWTGFTGYFGVTEFVDGVSAHEVSGPEARRIAAVVQVETLDGHNPSAAQQIIDSRAEPLILATSPKVDAEAPAAPATLAMTYTVAELEGIADKGGIKALRDLAEPFGVKGRSIAEIIAELTALKAKVANAPVDQTATE